MTPKRVKFWSTQIGQNFAKPKNHCVLYLMPYHYAKLCTHAFARNENNLGRNDTLCLVFIFSSTRNSSSQTYFLKNETLIRLRLRPSKLGAELGSKLQLKVIVWRIFFLFQVDTFVSCCNSLITFCIFLRFESKWTR